MSVAADIFCLAVSVCDVMNKVRLCGKSVYKGISQ